jgi:ligand-binding sensor domain-containing protein
MLVAEAPWTTWTPYAIGTADRAVGAIHAAGGRLWIATSNGLFAAPEADLSSFEPIVEVGSAAFRAIAELADGSLVIGGAPGVWLSDPARVTWQSVGLTSEGVVALDVIGDAIVASTDSGVFVSRDRGARWSELDGVGGGASAVLVDPATGELVVGTNHRGLVSVPW